MIATLVLLSMFLGLQAVSLWTQWRALRWELDGVKSTSIVGYPNIQYRLSFATIPSDWYRVEGESVVLWAGWDQGVGNHWFHLNQGDLDRAMMVGPMGRDVIHAIERPWTETGGGRIWTSIPEESPVVGQMLEGLPCVYPMQVVRKVLVVNDLVNDHPYLVLCDPGQHPDRSVAIYDATLPGQRVTLGNSGYAFRGKPLLYDHKTESLWVEEGNSVKAPAGSGRVHSSTSFPGPWPSRGRGGNP